MVYLKFLGSRIWQQLPFMTMENIIMNMVKVQSNHQKSLEIFVLSQQSTAVTRSDDTGC